MWFQNLAVFVILINSIWIGVDIDYNSEFDDDATAPIPPQVFTIMDNIFCSIYVFEILVRLVAYKRPWYFILDPDMRYWNIFDFVLVGLMVIETWILPLTNNSANLRQFSTLRMLRMLRLGRLFRIVPEFRMMLKSLVAAARGVAGTLIILVLLMYIYAVVFTQWSSQYRTTHSLTDDAPPQTTPSDFTTTTPLPDSVLDDATTSFLSIQFGSVYLSMMTMFQIAIYDTLFSTIRETLSLNFIMGLLLISFIFIGGFLNINILIGVIAAVVEDETEGEKDRIILEQINDIFDLVDVDKSGPSTWKSTTREPNPY